MTNYIKQNNTILNTIHELMLAGNGSFNMTLPLTKKLLLDWLDIVTAKDSTKRETLQQVVARIDLRCHSSAAWTMLVNAFNMFPNHIVSRVKGKITISKPESQKFYKLTFNNKVTPFEVVACNKTEASEKALKKLLKFVKIEQV